MLWAGTNQINMASETGCEQQAPQQDTQIANHPIGEGVPMAAGNNNKVRTFVVKELSRGYTVEVGCQMFAIETKAQLISKLSEYINEPEKTEQKWFKNELF